MTYEGVAFQEYGLTSFDLQILAYCSPQELLSKGIYYFQLYQPEYNTSEENKEEQVIIDNSPAKLPTSLIKYNSFTKQLVLFQPPSLSLIPWKIKPIHLLIREIPASVAKVKPKKWIISEATRLKQSLAQQKRTKHPKPGFPVQVQDLVENKTTVYSSYREAARALNILEQTISIYLKRNQTKPHKKKDMFLLKC